MKQAIKRWLWKHYRRQILDRKGFRGLDVQQDEKFLALFYELYAGERRVILSLREMYNIYRLVQATQSVPGDIAEVGVFAGGSARIICEANGAGKPVHLFDTFAGMPATDVAVDHVREGVCDGVPLEDVKEFLSAFDGVSFYKGRFPETTDQLPESADRFAFVNLDVDIYQSTLDGLEYFYPKVSIGGCILSHDYRSTGLPGVKKAFDEFMADKPEPVIPLWESQALVVKQ